MRTPRTLPPAARAGLPWLAGWLAFQAALGVGGRVLARRWDEGDETSAGIRRVRTLGEVRLRPTNPELSRVRIDLLMAGGQVDLTALPRVPGGVDLTLRAAMGGLDVQVPPGWRVWWSTRGVGGVGTARGARVTPTDDERGADLRVHAGVLLGGVGIGTPS